MLHEKDLYFFHLFCLRSWGLCQHGGKLPTSRDSTEFKRSILDLGQGSVPSQHPLGENFSEAIKFAHRVYNEPEV